MKEYTPPSLPAELLGSFQLSLDGQSIELHIDHIEIHDGRSIAVGKTAKGQLVTFERTSSHGDRYLLISDRDPASQRVRDQIPTIPRS